MSTMRDHDVEDYATLRDMDATDVAVLDEDDRACLDEIGQYLVSTDAWQRFAIWLLHKHFEPAAGEVFVESVITAPRGTRNRACRALPAQGLNATSMCFDPDVSSGVGVIGMEFADPADFGSTSSVSPDDEAVLAGIAERLRAHGKTERFGVRLIRNPLDLGKTKCSSKPTTSHTGPCAAASVSATPPAPQHYRNKLAMGTKPEQDRAQSEAGLLRLCVNRRQRGALHRRSRFRLTASGTADLAPRQDTKDVQRTTRAARSDYEMLLALLRQYIRPYRRLLTVLGCSS